MPTAPAMPTFEIVNVTPTQAEQWLEHNSSNRKIRARVVDQYARDMTAGRWAVTGEPIMFGKSGDLLNGQHRLTAVIKADVPVMMAIARNVDDASMMAIDTGVRRTASDLLAYKGAHNPALTAAACRLAILWEDGRINTANSRDAAVSHPQMLEWYAQHDDMDDACNWTANNINLHVECTPTILATTYWRFSQIDPVAAREFMVKLATREGLEAGNPILALDHRLRDLKRRDVRPYGSDRRRFVGMIVRAWNAWRQGTNIQRLQFTTTDDRVPEPV